MECTNLHCYNTELQQQVSPFLQMLQHGMLLYSVVLITPNET